MRNDNGFAYPTWNLSEMPDGRRYLGGFGGFSKLEAYALAAMQALIMKIELCSGGDAPGGKPVDQTQMKLIRTSVAHGAFEYAVAMLAEYERRMKETP